MGKSQPGIKIGFIKSHIIKFGRASPLVQIGNPKNNIIRDLVSILILFNPSRPQSKNRIELPKTFSDPLPLDEPETDGVSSEEFPPSSRSESPFGNSSDQTEANYSPQKP
jgi:hypothetical protein